MENSAANQLPEVDSLPDGFVDSSVESLAPPTPTVEQEKQPLTNYKEDTSSKLECSSDERHGTEISELQSSEVREENMPKIRTFPVLLSEKESLDASGELAEEINKACLEQGKGTMAVPESAEPAGPTHGKEQPRGDCQNSERPIEANFETQTTQPKDISPSESVEIPKNRKTEISEVKRKTAKRSFKSEKEFLEFTLKYQQVIADRDGAIAVRDKLESLCRELQRQNKMLMDECKRVTAEGQSLRLDLSSRFHDAIKDVSNKLEEQKDEYLGQIKENEMLTNKLKQLAEQYALSEQQFAQKLKQKTLELQIAELKIQQQEEKSVQEQSQMKLYAEQVSQLLATEKNLRLQLTADGEKFQQFQDALLKSNEVFETFKQEIEKMAKSIKDLKKENIFLKSKCDKSDVTLIELVEEREHLKKQLEKTKNQKEKLESLCRSLQAERKQSSIGSISSDSVPT